MAWQASLLYFLWSIIGKLEPRAHETRTVERKTVQDTKQDSTQHNVPQHTGFTRFGRMT